MASGPPTPIRSKVAPLPPFRSPVPTAPRPLPPLSGFRESQPIVPGPLPETDAARRAGRRRVRIFFAAAAALHLGLVLAWWLTPPLRLKAGYSPDRWVQVVSIPQPQPPKPLPQPKQKPPTVAVPAGKSPRSTATVTPVFVVPSPAPRNP